MKNLKIKFGLFSLLAILAVSVFLTSCEQAIVETPVVSEMDRLQQLESDPNFIEISRLNAKLLEEVTHAMTTKGITGEDLKNIYMNQDVDAMVDFIQGTEIDAIMSEITPITQRLSTDYSDLISSNQNSDINLEEGFSKLESITSLESRCSWTYMFCATAVSAASAACVAGSGGWALAACYVAYAAGMAQCATICL